MFDIIIFIILGWIMYTGVISPLTEYLFERKINNKIELSKEETAAILAALSVGYSYTLSNSSEIDNVAMIEYATDILNSKIDETIAKTGDGL